MMYWQDEKNKSKKRMTWGRQGPSSRCSPRFGEHWASALEPASHLEADGDHTRALLHRCRHLSLSLRPMGPAALVGGRILGAVAVQRGAVALKQLPVALKRVARCEAHDNCVRQLSQETGATGHGPCERAHALFTCAEPPSALPALCPQHERQSGHRCSRMVRL